MEASSERMSPKRLPQTMVSNWLAWVWMDGWIEQSVAVVVVKGGKKLATSQNRSARHNHHPLRGSIARSQNQPSTNQPPPHHQNENKTKQNFLASSFPSVLLTCLGQRMSCMAALSTYMCESSTEGCALLSWSGWGRGGWAGVCVRREDGWSVGRSVAWSGFVDGLVGRLVGWLVACLLAWLGVWSVGWLEVGGKGVGTCRHVRWRRSYVGGSLNRVRIRRQYVDVDVDMND